MCGPSDSVAAPSKMRRASEAAGVHHPSQRRGNKAAPAATTMSLLSLLLLLAPLSAAIVIMRPSWSEFFLLALPLIAAIIAAFFAVRAASYLLFGVIGLLVGLCTLNIDAEERGVISAPVTQGLLNRLLQARADATPSERARRYNSVAAQARTLALARVIAAECVALSLVSAFVLA
jgi:hypothetical protein